MEWQKDQYTIDTDKSKLNIAMIHHFLYTTAHWAIGRPMSVVKKSIENSLCFGVYQGDEQIGFARLVTDGATVGWICDMFILPAHRGKGLGSWLVDCMMKHPDVAGLRRILLNTRDAHELYKKYAGFRQLLAPESWLERFNDSPMRMAEKSVKPGSKKPVVK
ncbi:MAG: GNAT family N-acetyltransferase [Anaerolineales bacterium]|nr:GNAT family N-acetyltransferase [Anaerolineae bacterium]PWB53475.1 MAG: GNAT family N-acetyltransferase [Anaerolineales bacterium]